MPAATKSDILCGVDFSKHSGRALRYGVALAQRLKSRITVIFVNDPLLDAAASVAYDEGLVLQRSERELRRFVMSAVGAAQAKRVDQVIVAGDPASELKRVAGQRGCGFIVLGTQGLRGSRHMFFGSTTERLLRTTDIPVLAIPPRAPHKPASKWPKPNVGCAVDLDAHLGDDIRSAAEVASGLGARLVVVHAVKPVSTPPWLAGRRGAKDPRLASAEDVLRSRVQQIGLEPAPDLRVLAGDPADAIASFAKRHLGLIVLRLRRGPGLLGSRPGTITYQILSLSAVPVLALPAAHNESS